MAIAPIAVNVDVGIAEALRLVSEIMSRRGQRKQQVVKDVLNDVEAAATVGGDTRKEAGKLRGLQHVLGRVADALDAYRANLDQAMGGASAPGRLAAVYELATSRVNGADVSAAHIREKAENTLREHDFELSERIYALKGELAQAARGN